jgi:hypothetical protein
MERYFRLPRMVLFKLGLASGVDNVNRRSLAAAAQVQLPSNFRLREHR